MPATIRDFSKSHPDFQSSTGKGCQGLVEQFLGTDGTPTFLSNAQCPNIPMNAFDDWYHDNGNSIAIPYTMDFRLISDDGPVPVFGFRDDCTTDCNAFFPIDNQGFGNEGFNNNYHFTLQASSAFVYEPGSFIDALSDDDLWIFIDGELVLDMGGLHSPMMGSANLDLFGFVPGEIYQIDIFFAERRSDESALSLWLGMALLDESVSCNLL
jgi:fibro-slime domain-containing protein